MSRSFFVIIAVAIFLSAITTVNAQPFVQACNLQATVAGNQNASDVVNAGLPVAILQTDAPEFVRLGKLQRISFSLRFIEPATDFYVVGRLIIIDGDQMVGGSSFTRQTILANPEGNGHVRSVKAGEVLSLRTDDLYGDEPASRQYRYDVCLATAKGDLLQHLETRHFIGGAKAKDRGSLVLNGGYKFPASNGPDYVFLMGSFPGQTLMCDVGGRLTTIYRYGEPTADILCAVPRDFIGPGTLDATVMVAETGETRTLPGVIIP